MLIRKEERHWCKEWFVVLVCLFRFVLCVMIAHLFVCLFVCLIINFGFINWVDNVNGPPYRDSKADVSCICAIYIIHVREPCH